MMEITKLPTSPDIYSGASRCSKIFEQLLNSDTAPREKRDFAKELWSRFNLWAAYAGAFALPKASLDARLADHEHVRDMFIQMLAMIERNLEYDLASGSATPDENCTKEVGKHDNQMMVGLRAVQMAIVRLNLLAVAVRRPSKRHITRNIGTHDSNEGVGDSSLRQLIKIYFPNAKPELLEQVMRSIQVRGASLEYCQRHNRKLAERRPESKSEAPPSEQKPDAVQMNDESTIKLYQEATTAPVSETQASSFNQEGFEQLMARPRISLSQKSTGSSIFVGGGRDLYAEIPRPCNPSGTSHAICQICGELLDAAQLSDREWKRHVNQDIEPYVCISEECSTSLRLFTTFRDWRAHMTSKHSLGWPWKIHTTVWSCNIEHIKAEGKEPQSNFTRRNDLLQHMLETHDKDFTKSQLLIRARQGKKPCAREEFTCPFCDCVPDELEHMLPERPYDALDKHIGRHLKQLAKLSLGYLDLKPNNTWSATPSETSTLSGENTVPDAGQHFATNVSDDDSASDVISNYSMNEPPELDIPVKWPAILWSPAATPMRRALLIEGLHAPSIDVETMKRLLKRFGFECETALKATRAQILDHLEDIIGRANANDAVVVYISGLEGLVAQTDEVNAKRPIRFLIPHDFADSTENDFRGITDVELSQYMRRITNKTENVTLISDSCHNSARVDPRVYDVAFSHIYRMLQDGTLDGGGYHESNPRLLAIATSAQTETVYDPGNGAGERSALTEALNRVLRRLNTDSTLSEVSWRTVMHSVRSRIKTTIPDQFPQIEGDDTRLIFSLEKASLNGALPFSFTREHGPVLEGGRLHGVEAGDTYALLPALVERFNLGRQIAEVTVDAVGPVKSRVSLKDGNLTDRLETHARSGMTAFPRKKIGRLPVAVRLSKASRQLSSRIEGSPFLCKAESNDSSSFATVASRNSNIELWTHELGESLLLGRWQVTGEHVDVQCVSEIIDRLESMARSRHLFSLARQVEPTALSSQVGVQVGRVRNGQPDTSGQEGDLVVTEGDRVFIKLRNIGRATVCVWIFEICAGSVMMLTAATPSGRELRPNEEYIFGELDMIFGTLQGSEVDWPESVPKTGLRLFENIVVVVTPGPVRIDLHSLETGSGPANGADGGTQRFDAPSLSDFTDDVGSTSIDNVSVESIDDIGSKFIDNAGSKSIDNVELKSIDDVGSKSIDNDGSKSTGGIKTQQTYVEFGMRVVSFQLNHN